VANDGVDGELECNLNIAFSSYEAYVFAGGADAGRGVRRAGPAGPTRHETRW